ncbi:MULTISPECIES: DUF523 domain-containing protein [Alphaproteobacteria]|uniref:Uncharacterized protein n=2 Tax=Alphaproteobacteria TaxID=28211 RepID=A0A512HHW9_9HYPH|nr:MULTISPECIES: DUF523 domain-containing protein [Alphaproteobacteria]GEO85056.1 hypothetical protein RNA01_19880 [Ciceribacter naphthalenivorans]GLR24610.1 hypothetical protein GCM10007920_44040 [Ciceribacter naphthalenivorans]GLT07466.1 hypothetical protein GCM10007926_44040 [Sphingomonas psychrolutea]
MEKILISACLLGRPVRYDGKGKPLHHPVIARWMAEGRLIGFCPEQSGGLPTPRPPAEIESGMNGDDVLEGRARVLEVTGRDVTAEFIAGAEKTVAVAKAQHCRFALLIDGSPSCGSGFIYDGSFSGVRHSGEGVTVALLRRAGIAVYADREIDALVAHLDGAAGSAS